MRLVIVTDGVATNVVEVPDDWTPDSAQWQPPKGSIAVLSSSGEIGEPYIDGEFLTPPSPPIIVKVPQIISDRQFFQQLAVLTLITEAEALAAVQIGTIPATLQGLVDALPIEQQFPAKMLLSGATQFMRTHPLTLTFGVAMGWTDAELDNLWLAASGL